MSRAMTTLGDMLLQHSPPTRAELNKLEATADTRSVKEQLRERDRRMKWRLARKTIRAALPELLDIPFLDVLLAGWDKLEVLMEYADKPAGEEARIPLGSYTMTSTHHPRLELLMDGAKVAELTFTVVLKLKCDAFVARISQGRIWGIETGRCDGIGEIWLGQTRILERTITKVALPGAVEFENGIPVPGPNRPYQHGMAARELKASENNLVIRSTGTGRVKKVIARLLILGIAGLAVIQSPELIRWLQRLTLDFRMELERLQPDKEQFQPLPAPRYLFRILPNPSDAKVRLLDSEYVYQPGMLLPPGPYQIEVTRSDYEPKRLTAVVVDRELSLPVTLQAQISPQEREELEHKKATRDENRHQAKHEIDHPDKNRKQDRIGPIPKDPTVPNDGKFAIYLDVTPSNANVTIYHENGISLIGKYHPGMQLPPGQYKVFAEVDVMNKYWGEFTIVDRDLHKRIHVTQSILDY